MGTIIYILLALLLLGIMVTVHELGHFCAARACGIAVRAFGVGFGPKLLSWTGKKSGTEYSLRLVPCGGFCAFYGEDDAQGKDKEDPRSMLLQPAWKRLITIAAGPVMNFVLGFVVLLILLTAQSSPLTSKVIYAVEDSALCGQTGLQAGDEIVAVNGRRCFVANDIIYELVRTEQYRADFTVLRDGQTVELPDVQFDTWTDEAGQVHMSLGFTVYGLAKTPRNVLREAGNSMLYYGRIIFTSLADLLRGRENINNLFGPVGIVTAIGQAASYGWQDLLQLLALITINLGIFNLLPFPALDGGKVVFLAIEGITGHAVPEKLQGSLTVAAFALLFGLMIFATYNDIIRLITGAV